MLKIKKIFKISLLVVVLLLVAAILFWWLTKASNDKLVNEYKNRRSAAFYDRHGGLVYLRKNYLGNYAVYVDQITPSLEQKILKKEDRFFYYHLGFNPWRLLVAAKSYFLNDKNEASSTITQQLAKLLLSQENNRNLPNKIRELFFALVLEAHNSKKDILKMYVNSVFLGNNTQGVEIASHLYFGAGSENLSQIEELKILATINSPANNHPFSQFNSTKAGKLGEIFGIKGDFLALSESEIKRRQNDFSGYVQGEALFEWAKFLNNETNNNKNYKLSADQQLSAKIRAIIAGNLRSLASENVSNGAAVVIKLPENQVLAVIGSPDYRSENNGAQINMALSPRPIGSTIKPFIYLRGFQKNLRPYTVVDDKEYKYTIGTGFAFYPKNYDYKYHGQVSLHYALSNSLNVPAVKVLEYVGLDDFYGFLDRDLGIKPAQKLENYQLAIALGGLELNLLDLSYYFTIFPQEGKLLPLSFGDLPSGKSNNKVISDPKYVQLVNKILSDRLTGVEQFGPAGNLVLKYPYYAVKTGTSQEYRDSWTVGYTGDFLVGVWVGNSDNSKMKEISGQEGAGRIWQEIMNLMLNSEYNKKTLLDFSLIRNFPSQEGLSYGLSGDDFEQYKNLLKQEDLIESPHDGDVFLWQKDVKIPLKSKDKVQWLVAGQPFSEDYFTPRSTGVYEIEAVGAGKKQSIKITIEEDK